MFDITQLEIFKLDFFTKFKIYYFKRFIYCWLLFTFKSREKLVL